jgi:hypothetical protein
LNTRVKFGSALSLQVGQFSVGVNSHAVSTTLFRVVHDAPNHWVLICSACREKVETQPLYRYGGTWKADKRH